ncbi:serine O-acetyltransferase [Leptolyngbya ohadii]|uniref:serine O-acetyltransferase n=1 Tax=Leptolyngbya ohadii TaxID=1962290 RepID=UPI001CECEBA6|nr:serine O-acetyltransferase [Leptolyngbya ohadii]
MHPSLNLLWSPVSRFFTSIAGSQNSHSSSHSQFNYSLDCLKRRSDSELHFRPSSGTISALPQKLLSRLSSSNIWQALIWQTLREDFRIIFERDPAAHHWLEVLCCYPGLHALLLYRLNHWLHAHRVPFLPRFLAHLTRFLTGIEIHPGATIGKGVFIDHGMGVVIGETAIVGDYCLIYQGVTLGGTGKETGKRHPTLGDHVVVGAGAKVLGNIHIGDYARVGAGSIVLRNVPAHCTAVGVPGRNLCRPTVEDCPLEHGQMPDAQAVVMRVLLDRIEALEQQVQQLTQS